MAAPGTQLLRGCDQLGQPAVSTAIETIMKLIDQKCHDYNYVSISQV